jgi:epoxyqueuosine reductase
LLRLDDAAFREMFAGSPIKRIGRNRMIRNCLVAAGNSGSAALAASVEPHLADPDPVIAEAAAWAMSRLQERVSEAMQAG